MKRSEDEFMNFQCAVVSNLTYSLILTKLKVIGVSVQIFYWTVMSRR